MEFYFVSAFTWNVFVEILSLDIILDSQTKDSIIIWSRLQANYIDQDSLGLDKIKNM